MQTTVGFEGWIQINVTTTFSDWILIKMANNLLYVKMEFENEFGHLITPIVDVNYLLSFTDGNHQPFIIAYFESADGVGHILEHKSMNNISTIHEVCI